ncbi:MAG: response regulator [Myxococcota bacterium]
MNTKQDSERSLPERGPPAPLNHCVLLADADPGIRAVVAGIAAELGLKTLAASNGPDALRLYAANAESIAVVVLDLTLPGMGGPGALAAIRSLRIDVPVVLCSSVASQTSEEIAGRDRSSFVLKPLARTAFKEHLAEVLRAHTRQVG